MFISQIMKEDSVYFTSDISDTMISLFNQRFTESEIAMNPKTKLK